MTQHSRARAAIGSALLCVAAACTASAQAGPQATPASRDEASLVAFEQRLRPTVLRAGEAAPGWSIEERMAHYHVPGVAIAILRDGRIVRAAGYGVRQVGTSDAVDANTLFSVGSVSKVATAAVALRLVDRGTLDLDRDVNGYLTSWRVPPSHDVVSPVVTLRMLMSHTAGFNVHGFADFAPGEPMPTLVQILDGTGPAKNDPIRLIHQPGSRMDYSGGGVMVEQLVIEDVTGKRLEDVARAELFEPIGMRRSTFANPLPADRGNIARAHDEKGAATALPRGWESFPESAASGLWTSATDLGVLLGALIDSYRGRSDVLSRSVAMQMMTEVAPSWHGLGPRLDSRAGMRIFHHGGSNQSYQAWIEGNLDTGDGLVILTNGAEGSALAGEIRNAVSDALDWRINPPVRAIDLDLRDASYADHAGIYHADGSVPIDIRRALVDMFPIDTMQVDVAGGILSARRPGTSGRIELLPLSPNRFVAPQMTIPAGTLEFEFHRGADGVVRALTVHAGAASAYYRHAPREQRSGTSP